MNERLRQQIAFSLEIDKLKNVFRQTLLTDGSRRENSAEHSWHLAMMAQLLTGYCAEPVDLGRVLRLVLAHDLVEIDAGDTFVYDEAGCLSKREREVRAAERIFPLLPADQAAEFRALWDEFEEALTPEARYANALDCLQPLLNHWTVQGVGWREHAIRKSQVLKRMRPIEAAMPEIWRMVCALLDEAVANGWLRDE